MSLLANHVPITIATTRKSERSKSWARELRFWDGIGLANSDQAGGLSGDRYGTDTIVITRPFAPLVFIRSERMARIARRQRLFGFPRFFLVEDQRVARRDGVDGHEQDQSREAQVLVLGEDEDTFQQDHEAERLGGMLERDLGEVEHALA